MFVIGGLTGYIIFDKDPYGKYKRKLAGFYSDNSTLKSVEKYQDRKDPRGDWVSINVRGIDFSRGLEVCQHECGHAVYSEIFAEICEKNMTKCTEILEGLGNDE